MKRNVVLLAVAVFFFLFSAGAVFAQRGSARGEVVNIRLASPLPRATEWGNELENLASEWQRISNNEVRVTISHDGREGSEAKMLSSLRSNNIQAAVFTSAGIAEICPAVMNLSVPFLIRNESELDAVLPDVLQILERRLDPNFVIIAWSKGGWIYFFSKEKIITPDDLKRQKIGTSPDLDNMNTAFRTMGFTLVEEDWQNLGVKLANNTINTVYVIPSIIAPMQLHRSLRHMLEMPIAPVMGAIVMNRVTWDRLPPAHQQTMLRSARQMSNRFNSSVSRTENNAIASMGRTGLTVNKPTQANQTLWQTELEQNLPSIIGPIFDRDLYNEINNMLARYRAGR